MVSVVVLCIEILLDAIGFVAGFMVLVRSSDNKLQRAWGVLAVSLSSLLLYDNIEWIYLFSQGVDQLPRYTELPLDHLSLWHIFRVIIFLQFFSLFPIASLRPGWLTLSKIINFSIPTILISSVALCYELFNGHITTLKSFNDICRNITNQDVIVRLILFVLSVVAPSANILFIFLKKWIPLRRKQNQAMFFYLISFGIILAGYIWLMLGTTSLSFNMFGYIVIVPAIYMNILCLCSENPLSLPLLPAADLKSEELEAIKEIEVSPAVLELSEQLRVFMKEKAPFTNAKYSLEDLSRDLKTNENRLNKALRYDGFLGFRDYINYHRLQYFKEQAILHKEQTVKELMFASGFTSRSSFYRYFSSIEKMSPGEYIEMLQKQNEVIE